MSPSHRRLPVLILLVLALAVACAAPEGEAPAVPAPVAVDPQQLEAELEEAPLAQEPTVSDWAPVLDPVSQGGQRAALRAAAKARDAGRWLSLDDQASTQASLPPVEPGDAPEAAAEPGALVRYLAVLASDPEQADALAGISLISDGLILRGRAALDEGHLLQARRIERIVSRAQPGNGGLASYQQAIEAAQRARDLVHRGDARFKAGRIFRPEGKGAVAAYRAALQAYPGFLPARDGLARLQADHLNRALAAAQAGDYPESERLLADAGRIVADSAAHQDMAARVVELRQARTEQLMAQGHAAVDALDLELAASRLAQAERVSVQAVGLDALKERIELARHYGRFRPGQIFSDALSGGGQGPEMVVLAHGTLRMGSPEDEPQRQDSEGPVHAVAFERGFALARSETTVAEFARFVQATGYRSLATRQGRSSVYDERMGAMSEHSGVDWRRDHAGKPAGADLPVVHVAFEDAEAFVAWLSAQTGQRYRLPSEAEFEYALRGGRTERFSWGSGPPLRVVGNLTGEGDRSGTQRRWSNAIAGYSDGFWGPAPVRSFPAEALGTFDLVGNVSEWVQDCWHDSYRRAPADGSAWVNPGCEERVVRGASWASTLDRARSAYRQASPADTTHARLGFRAVRDL